MRKTVIGFTLSTLLFALSYSASAQQPNKVQLIGYISSQDPRIESARAEAIRLALRELGYLEGQNIAIDYRYAEGKPNRLPALAAELVHLKVDIIVTGVLSATRPGNEATNTIPILMSRDSET